MLRDIELNLAPGSFHFLTGASGAGKSSLLETDLSGAEVPTSSGLITLFGQDISSLSRQCSCRPCGAASGWCSRSFACLDHLSAFDNVALAAANRWKAPGEYRADIAELLTWVGLGQRMHAMPPTLSGGEKQRLAIARAVVGKPDVLLADELTGNVDREMGLRILRLFMELNKLGTTLLIATHDLDMVARCSGQPVLRLDQGQLFDGMVPA